MDSRKTKFIVGLALENAIVYRQNTEELEELYQNPQLGKIKTIYDHLIKSQDHNSRTVAIWLELALEQGSLTSDSRRLAIEIKEMEYVLYNLISKSSKAKRELNYWMNYMANAANFLLEGLWIDAKIIVSRAVQESKKSSIEDLKMSPSIGNQVDILQRATLSYLEELKRYPVALDIKNVDLDQLIRIQEPSLTLLRKYKYGEISEKENRYAKITIHRLSSAIRHMMDDAKEKSEKDLTLATRYLEAWIECRVVEDKEEMKKILRTIQKIVKGG